MAKRKTSKKQIDEAAFHVALKINGLVVSSMGPTLDEAILALPRMQPKTIGIFTITKDGKTSKEIPLTIPNVNRLFAPGMTGVVQRSVFAKRYSFFA